jgi:hypothetical protein
MKARNFQYLSGLTVLMTHIVAVAMIFTATRFTDSTDQVGSILIVTPITLVYASAFIRFVVNDPLARSRADDEQFDPLAAITMYFVVIVFCASLIFVVVKFVYLSSFKPNEFKMWLGAAESAFGALVATIWERLFGQGTVVTPPEPVTHPPVTPSPSSAPLSGTSTPP